MEVEAVDAVGLRDHFERKFDQGNFPGIIDAFEDGEHGIARLADIGQQLLANLFDGLMDNLFRNIRAAEAEAVLEKGEVDALTVQ